MAHDGAALMCTTPDCQLGAIQAIMCVMVGVLITLLGVALWPHRAGPDEPPGPPPGPDDGDPIALATDELRDDLNNEIDAWLKEHAITEPFEANLLGGLREEAGTVTSEEVRRALDCWNGAGYQRGRFSGRLG